MISKIHEFINKNQGDNVVFVLKGFDTTNFKSDYADLSHIIKNKVKYLYELSEAQLRVISFDEFICLSDFVLAQFSFIYILENQIYNHYYPKNVYISDTISTQLLSHFDSDGDNSLEIGNLNEFTNVYNNYQKTTVGIACSYNYDEKILRHEKVECISIIPNIQNDSDILANEVTNIYTESDYFSLVQNLFLNTTHFSVQYDSFVSGKKSIERKIELLLKYFPNRITISTLDKIATPAQEYSKIIPLMKEYWGHSSFRNVNFYDVEALKERRKEVISISQGEIISSLIQQVENCLERKNFRDIFVTAPTGAGKSVMFQLPAMYLAQEYNLITLVITPLIGLMNDQVSAFKKRGYLYARTINSDMSPLLKQDILEEVANGQCHILYLSPESLLSRSDIQQLIGNRRIGMVVIDEAHIVTTWGKQFRPDYWYLGDHIQKTRRTQAQLTDNPMPFIVATFTATAIYEGNEDMYHETLNSVHMIDPITYLGYVRRTDLTINISEIETKTNKTEYELNKFENMIQIIQTAIMRNKKMLIYFPTVALISRFYAYCCNKNLTEYVTKYHGQLPADQKTENFNQYLHGEKLIMLATKAFGMGIDIPDIEIVSHYAPTGNVCDYMQEIGRAARDPQLNGEAIYQHMKNDFQHINRLHGLSMIQRYQLVEVIKKVLEIYTRTRYQGSRNGGWTKKKNEMLVDAESFSYIFETNHSDQNDMMNKVKTAMLLIQKDYENRGFAPFHIRPISLFALGYFSISPKNQNLFAKEFPNSIKLIHQPLNICEINLKDIWEKHYEKKISFPKFKYFLYTKSADISISNKYDLKSALSIDISLEEKEIKSFYEIFNCIKDIVMRSCTKGKYVTTSDFISEISKICKINKYRGENIVNIILASLSVYQKDISKLMNARIYQSRSTKNGEVYYQFHPAVSDFFKWIQVGFEEIQKTVETSNKIYVVNDIVGKSAREITTLLGIFESIGVVKFNVLGGSNSQIYIYVNETKSMQMVQDKPQFYRNRLLEAINDRHRESVNMLTFLFQNKFTSDEIWDHLENYFLGILPNELSNSESDSQTEEDDEIFLQIEVGEPIDSHTNWNQLYSTQLMSPTKFQLALDDIPVPQYFNSKFILGSEFVPIIYLWFTEKIALLEDSPSINMQSFLQDNGWKFILKTDLDQLKLNFFKLSNHPTK